MILFGVTTNNTLISQPAPVEFNVVSELHYLIPSNARIASLVTRVMNTVITKANHMMPNHNVMNPIVIKHLSTIFAITLYSH